MAAIASALLVELFVSLLQHPEGAAAPAPASRTEDQGDHPLGLVPHQIRGFLSRFENIPIVGKSYRHCSACSDAVTSAYKEDGWKFVQRSLNESGYVEDLSGLKEVRKKKTPPSWFLFSLDTDEASQGPNDGRSYRSRNGMGRK